MITASAAMGEIPFYAPEGAILVLYPDGIDTPLPTPTQATITSADEVGGNRDVWLFSGTAARNVGVLVENAKQPGGSWTWAGRSATAAPPASATFNGANATVTTSNGVSTVTVVGDGTLRFDTGGELVIARGLPTAAVTVRLR